jgi:hypothetical protein
MNQRMQTTEDGMGPSVVVRHLSPIKRAARYTASLSSLAGRKATFLLALI